MPETSPAQLLAGAKRRAVEAAYRRYFRYRSNPRPLDAADALDLPGEPRVLFLCYGNVCRSPFAERYARGSLRESGVGGWTVESAGFFDREGRSSPDAAVDAARRFDVDLSDHRSRRVAGADLRRSDAVFLMDVRNYRLLRAEFDAPAAYFLKAFADAPRDVEIPDPYGSDPDTFRAVYREVAAAVDRFVEAATTDDAADATADAADATADAADATATDAADTTTSPDSGDGDRS